MSIFRLTVKINWSIVKIAALGKGLIITKSCTKTITTPAFETLEDIAEFWDTHSTADYDDLTHEVQFQVQLHKQDGQVLAIALLPELSKTIQELARVRGVSAETLVNVWLSEKVFNLV